MGDLSQHFSRSEFRCKGHGVPGHVNHTTVVSQALVDGLERLRANRGGKPLYIVSGHRCVWWNSRVGGAKASRHIPGEAADLGRGYATVAQAEAAGFRGIGRKGNMAVHVDVRRNRARWAY